MNARLVWISMGLLAVGGALSAAAESAVGGAKAPAAGAPGANRASRVLISQFPRTKELLAFLAKDDPATHRKVLAAHRHVRSASKEHALRLAREHHPELFTLLESLKDREPKAYEEAVDELTEVAVRLAKQAESDPEAYRQDLAEWAAKSRIRLLTARLALSDDEQVRQQLLKLLQEKQQLDQERLGASIEKAERQLDRMRAKVSPDVEAAAAKELEGLSRKARKKRQGKGS